jgi:chromosome partitioning protein
MNVITVASRKGGAGKTTLCAQLAAIAYSQGKHCQLIDGDPQGSLTLCNQLRAQAALPIATAERGIDRAVALAQVAGVEWVFIDTSPTMWVVVQAAIRAATLLLIPARPGFLDLDAVRETVKTARERNKPYAVVLNACPVKRDEREAPAVAASRVYLEREGVPVFAGQISHRAAFNNTLALGASVAEADQSSLAAAEIARLWSAVEKSVAAINAAHAQAAA